MAREQLEAAKNHQQGIFRLGFRVLGFIGFRVYRVHRAYRFYDRVCRSFGFIRFRGFIGFRV